MIGRKLILSSVLSIALNMSYGIMICNVQSIVSNNDKISAIEMNIERDIKAILPVAKIGGNNMTIKHIEYINFICTFYGRGDDENGIGRGDMNAIGGKLSRGTVASNNFNMGTKIHLDKIGNVKVLDTGSTEYIKQIDDNTYVIDVFVERNLFESEKHYKKRISNMGKQSMKGYIVK
jgi:3D (Asp-Asp-Asp) domain-containing protein